MADVSGKGIPAALFMMGSKILVQNYAMAGMSPGKILEAVNHQICGNNREQMFVTVWLGVLELSTGKLTCANAGHEYPVLKTPEGDFEVYRDKHGFVIGGMDNMRYKEYELTLAPGTKLFVYTDGVPEATDADGSLFGMERLRPERAEGRSPRNAAQERPRPCGRLCGGRGAVRRSDHALPHVPRREGPRESIKGAFAPLKRKKGLRCFPQPLVFIRYSKRPYIATASSTERSPMPTRNAAVRIWTVSGSLMPSASGDRMRSEGPWPKGA